MRMALFGVLSVVAHGLLFLVAWVADQASGHDDPILQFKLPTQAEFGVVGGTGEPAPSEAPPPAPPPKQAKKAKKKKRKRVEKKVVTKEDDGFGPAMDASVPDPLVAAEEEADEAAVEGPEQDGEGSEISGIGMVQGATGEGLGVGSGGHGMGGFAPPGAHIGLHVNTKRVADTSLILEVRSLMNIIPGWERLIEASGIDPLNHLSNIFVATPDMRKSSVVVAARFKGTGKRVRKAVARLSKHRHKPAPWRENSGVELAPWYAPDKVDRTIAVTDQHRFIITRSDDVMRVVSVVRALAAAEERGKHPMDPRAPKILAQLYRKEAVALSIEDSRKFVVGEPPGIPRRARLSVRSLDEMHAGLAVIGQYESKAKATEAKKYLLGVRDKLLDHSQVKFLGLVSALEAAEIQQDGRYLVLDMRLTMHQTRFLLDYLSDIMRPGR